LNADYSELEEIGHLPITMQYLNVSETNLETIDISHLVNLNEFMCIGIQNSNFNLATVIAHLHEGLEELHISGNDLAKMPHLPSTLKILECEYCDLEEMSPLPHRLEKLMCSDNKLKTLGIIPASLLELKYSDNEMDIEDLGVLPPRLVISH
jgi:Leucine-rich repeat (LRR) protein